MVARKSTVKSLADRYLNKSWAPDELDLIAEEPFLIRIDDKPYSVVMRTPGDEQYHAAGFCLGEGIIDSADDLLALDYDESTSPNVFDVRLKPQRRKRIPDVLKRRSFVSQSSCGVCGKELIEDLYQQLQPMADGPELDAGGIMTGINTLAEKQKYYHQTKGSHAALILDTHHHPLAFAEDVGRHNALDKAIGNALLNNRLEESVSVILSSRSSHELVQKAARARVPIVISFSRPTGLAVEMAGDLNMTLGFAEKGSELVILRGRERIRTP